MPDLSFGTHFFQDLVESGIRYLPLYPDDAGVVFNEAFLLGAPNLLAEMLPEHAHLADVVRVIDVPQATGGLVLRVLMNADSDEAIGLLAAPGDKTWSGRSRTLRTRRLHDEPGVRAAVDRHHGGRVEPDVAHELALRRTAGCASSHVPVDEARRPTSGFTVK